MKPEIAQVIHGDIRAKCQAQQRNSSLNSRHRRQVVTVVGG